MQLSYFRVQGDSFSLTNAMRVDQDDADSLTGRLGLVVGRTILMESGSGWQFSVKAGLAHEFLDFLMRPIFTSKASASQDRRSAREATTALPLIGTPMMLFACLGRSSAKRALTTRAKSMPASA